MRLKLFLLLVISLSGFSQLQADDTEDYILYHATAIDKSNQLVYLRSYQALGTWKRFDLYWDSLIGGQYAPNGAFLIGITGRAVYQITPKLSAYGSTGPSYTTIKTPLRRGVQFFNEIGVRYEFRPQWSVNFGFVHISNAGLRDHNPGLDLITIGLQFPY